MKNLFSGYYPPTDAEYDSLWRESTVVLDTNVLLYLYKVPASTRGELLAVLEKLKQRLWIPHQVALEYQNARLKVIASERRGTEDALISTSDAVAKIKEKVGGLEIDKRELGLDASALLGELERASVQLQDAMTKAHTEQLDISGDDPIRASLDALFDGRVGRAPANQQELDELIAGGEERFRDRVPPGFMDADKDKDPSEAQYVFDQIRYPKKFGDLILWRQLINHVKVTGGQSVLFITADNKEDWWWRVQGKTMGPHSELVREIERLGKVKKFWMYSLFQFMENSNKYLQARVSKQSLDEIEEVTSRFRRASSTDSREEKLFSFLSKYRNAHLTGAPWISDSQEAVARWLISEGELVEANVGFPDLISTHGEEIRGYEVKQLRSADEFGGSLDIDETLFRGSLQVQTGRLTQFHLFVVLPQSDLMTMVFAGRQDELEAKARRFLKDYSVSSICIGLISKGTFVKASRFYAGNH